MSDLVVLNSLRACCELFPQVPTYWIAYSGGLDSHVLLDACAHLQAEKKFQFAAIHINHSLSTNADAWAAHCKQVCAQYHIPLHAHQIKLSESCNIEAQARTQRYALFEKLMQAGDLLLTAHHQDDQAETVLLQLLRGGGLSGMAAMPKVKNFAKGLHARPFLNLTRQTLQAYAQSQQLQFIEDESNLNQNFSRNFIRHSILPLLNQHWPRAKNTLARTAAYCAEANDLLTRKALPLITEMAGTRTHTLSVEKLLQQSLPVQKLILREWIRQQGFSLPPTKKLLAIITTLLTAGADKQPSVTWESVMLRRFQNNLYLCSQSAPVPAPQVWQLDQPCSLPNGDLIATKVTGKGLKATLKTVEVRFRQGGEVMHVQGRHRKTLKHLFQEWEVPPWERSHIPLIFFDQKLIAVVGYAIDADYAVAQDESGHVITLTSG